MRVNPKHYLLSFMLCLAGFFAPYSAYAQAAIGVSSAVQILPDKAATLDVDGTPSVGFGPKLFITWTVENLGTVPLTDITLVNDLDVTFGAGNYGTVFENQYPEIIGLEGAGTINRNSNYNGSTDTNVLAAGSTLAPGSILTIRTEVILLKDISGTFQNQATAGATELGSDTSSAPTEFIIGSSIGVAKNATVNGNEVTFDIYLEAFGSATLSQLSLAENLDGVFGGGDSGDQDVPLAPNYTLISAPVLIDDPGTFNLNPGFDGSSDQEFLAAGSTLNGGDTAQIQFVVRVNQLINQGLGLGLGEYQNEVLVTAEQPNGAYLLDYSDFGTDPDPNGDGNPTDFDENDPTLFTLIDSAVVGVAKDAAVSGTQVTIDLYLENLGTQTATNLSLTDDLDAVFGAGNYTLLFAPALIDDPGTLVLNGGYDGSATTELLAAGSSLAAGDTAQIQFVVNISNRVNSQGFGVGIYQNQASVSGTDANGVLVADLSGAGTDPDPNGDGDPGFPAGLADPPVPGENDPTVIVLSDIALGAALHASVNGVFVTLDYYVENLGDVTITNISVAHNLFSVFGFNNYTVSQAPVLLDGPVTMNPSAAFDGTFIQTLIAGGSLAAGEKAQIRVVLEITTVINGGVYNTQFTVSGISPITVLSDLSDAGITTDANDNGNPADAGEDDPTTIILGEEASLGVAKTASVNGNEVTFDIYLENLGNVTLSNLSLSDDLDAVFGATNYSLSSGPTLIVDPGTLTLNGAYDGSVSTELLDSASTLASGATAQIQMVVDVTSVVDQGLGAGSYENQVVAAGTAPSGSVAQDLSDAGTDPDPDGNNNPADAGENDPTAFMLAFDLPVVGIAKQATVAGNQVTFDIFIENLGNTLLSNFSLFEDLDAVFGAGNYSLVSGPDLVSPRQDLMLNANFDGSANKQLLTGGSLLIGDIEQIRFVVDVITLADQGSGVGVYSNQLTVNAEGPGSTLVSDLSDDGTDPDPDGNSNPADTGENDPTVFSIVQMPVIGVASTAAVANRTVTFDYYLENFGNITLNNLSLVEDLDAVFGAVNYSISSAPVLITDPGTVTLNGAYDGSANSDLLVPGVSTLALGATVQIQLVVDIDTVTDQGLGLGQYENQVTASAISPDNTPTTDLSDDGTDPDPNGNNDPADAGENDPTLIVLGAVVNGFIWNDLNGDGTQDIDEPGLSGITVFLSPVGTASGTPNSAMTPVKASPLPGDPTAVTVAGDFTLVDVPAGSYLLQVDDASLPVGARLTSGTLPLAVTLQIGEELNDVIFGFQLAGQGIPALNQWGLAIMVLLLLGLLWQLRMRAYA